jgi:hypothetical protein
VKLGIRWGMYDLVHAQARSRSMPRLALYCTTE